MQHNRTLSISALFRKPLACLLAATLSLLCLPVSNAFAADTERKEALQEQSQELMNRIDELQTQLNQAQLDYDAAKTAHDEAVTAMSDAQKRVEAAESRIAELEVSLSDHAVLMYKTGGAMSFLDVLMGTSSFEEFLTQWDLIERVTAKDAELIAETRETRAEAESARQEYSTQEQIAADEMAKQESLQQEITSTQASLNEEIGSITDEIMEIEAQEAAEAEEARKAAEAAEAAAKAAEEAAAKAKEQQTAAASSGSSSSSSSAGAAATDTGSGIFCHPCPSGTLSSGFGYRDFDSSFHKGIDLACAEGTPYYAAESGTVIYATYDGGYNGGAGNWIVISHGNGLVTKYMHSSAVYVSVGQHVTRGENIGAVGNTGDSYGAHLHFQVEVNGTAVSPWTYL